MWEPRFYFGDSIGAKLQEADTGQYLGDDTIRDIGLNAIPKLHGVDDGDG